MRRRPRRVGYGTGPMPPSRAGYRYHAWVLEALAAHGVCPGAATPPELPHDFVNDLYRYELRRLRAALLSGAFPKTEYYGRVVALRRRYPLLSLKPGQWADEG
jgi:hypothetical protein